MKSYVCVMCQIVSESAPNPGFYLSLVHNVSECVRLDFDLSTWALVTMLEIMSNLEKLIIALRCTFMKL